MNSRILLCLLITTFVLQNAQAQDQSEPPPSAVEEVTFSVEQIREDFLVMRGAILEAHPGLYRFTDRRSVHAFFDATWASLDRPMTEFDLFRTLSPINGVIKCGHTKMLLSRETTNRSIQEDQFLPLQCSIIGNRLFIRENLSLRDDLVEGSEILTINGESSRSVIDRLRPSLWADGDIDLARNQKLADDFLLWYAWLIGTPDQYDLVLSQPDGAEQQVELEALTLTMMREQHARRSDDTEEPADPPGQFELLEQQNAAVLTINSLFNPHYERAGMNFENFLSESFETIEREGVEQLIIDVRGNGGGNDVNGRLLVSHLFSQPIPFYRSIAPVTRIFSYTKYTPVEDPAEIDEIFERFTLTEQGGYEWKTNEKLAAMVPASLVFEGRVIVLIDEGSFSGAAEIASLLRHHKRAEFVGRETGGTYVGNNSGPGLDIHLPNSGIRFHMPFYRYEMAVDPGEHPTRGILPDHEITPTMDDLISDRDMAMEYAIELLRNR
ncbi:MAG: S41 family peptidase [Planctomycetota bacterium]|nr:S41 family peptidase [Planctomycetota bacterium]